jgi:hypothetical protein
MANAVPKDQSQVRRRTRYADDLYTWVSEQVALLRAGQLNEIDAAEVAEELDDVGSEQYDKMESALRVLVMHMLKWDQQPEYRTAGWVYSIREQRKRYAKVIKRNPGLKSRRDEALADAYESARLWAANETNLSPREFPAACPYGWDDILSRPFGEDEAG